MATTKTYFAHSCYLCGDDDDIDGDDCFDCYDPHWHRSSGSAEPNGVMKKKLVSVYTMRKGKQLTIEFYHHLVAASSSSSHHHSDHRCDVVMNLLLARTSGTNHLSRPHDAQYKKRILRENHARSSHTKKHASCSYKSVLRNQRPDHHRHHPIMTITPKDACRFRFRQVYL